MTADLEKCLLQENEQYLFNQKAKLADSFPKIHLTANASS
jgi:hypothetical protein